MIYLFVISLFLTVKSAYATDITVEDDSGASAYSLALELCADKGGLAQFIFDGSRYVFTCSDDLSREYSIG